MKTELRMPRVGSVTRIGTATWEVVAVSYPRYVELFRGGKRQGEGVVKYLVHEAVAQEFIDPLTLQHYSQGERTLGKYDTLEAATAAMEAR
jgi:hypothetical protein